MIITIIIEMRKTEIQKQKKKEIQGE